MKFGPTPGAEALGATAVHSIRQGALTLKKGTLIGEAEIAALQAAGVKEIVVWRLQPGDVPQGSGPAGNAAAEPAALQAAGVRDIVVSRLEPGNVSEDQAAADIAAAVKGEGVRADHA